MRVEGFCRRSRHAGWSRSWDNSIRKWDVSASKCIIEFRGHQDPVCCLAAAGEVLLSGSRDCSIRAWRVDTAECIKVLSPLILPTPSALRRRHLTKVEGGRAFVHAEHQPQHARRC